MTAILTLLLIALFAKDVLPLGDRFILRGVSEGMALIVGFTWMIQQGTATVYKRYIIAIGYLSVLLVTVLIARQPEFVGLQWLTLAGIVLFFIAYIETPTYSTVRQNSHILKTVILLFTLVCGASLILLYLNPELAYEREEQMVLSLRFKGLYGKSGQIASVSGLLFGLALFFRWFWWIRLTAVVVALPCLYLSGTRGAWVAVLAGVILTAFKYGKHRMTWVAGLSLVGVLVALFLTAGDLRISQESRDKMLRGESLQNLSGRLLLWEFAMKKFLDRPILGYGFTAGADALDEGESPAQTLIGAAHHGLGTMSAIEKKSYSLHNGYVQALLDSGVVGVCFYLVIMGLALWRLLHYDQARLYSAELYAFLFLLVFNLSHSLILGAGTLDSVFYWYLAIFGLSLASHQPRKAIEPVRVKAEIFDDPAYSVAVARVRDSDMPSTSTPRFPLVTSKN